MTQLDSSDPGDMAPGEQVGLEESYLIRGAGGKSLEAGYRRVPPIYPEKERDYRRLISGRVPYLPRIAGD